MEKNRKGIAPITIVLSAAIGIAILGGAFYYFASSASLAPQPVIIHHPVATSTPPTATSTPIHPASSTSAGITLSPRSGSIGSTVTIHGSNFAPTGNKVLFDGMVAASMNNLASADGKTLTFTVPQDLGPDCKPNEMCAQYLMMVGARAYVVTVVSNGVSRPVGTFLVTGAAASGHLPM